MGSVWLADHLALEIPCAIKFIDREPNSADARRRFEREAKAAAQLRGQHVVQILDHGSWEGIPYIAMEYLEGEDLAARLERVVCLPHAQTLRIVSQVAKGLTRAHAAGIVHRDLKPENIFLTKDGDDEVVKVLDFGIAKHSQAALSEAGTKTGSLLGTPFYMSPEQARGVKAIDHRSDLFSLAIIAYQCVTGQLPFYSEGLGDVLAQIMYEPIPVPSQRVTHVPPGFDGWWQRAASRSVEERFQSAKELADALALALGISNTIDIPMLEPRPPNASSAEISERSPFAPTRLALGGTPPLGSHPTIDRPFARTFDPTDTSGSARRKKSVLLGVGGLALSIVVLLFAFGGGKSRGSAVQGAVTAQAAGALDRASQSGALATAAASEEAPPIAAPAVGDEAETRVPGARDVGAHGAAISNTSAPAAPAPARRKPKAVKGTSGKHDYGI